MTDHLDERRTAALLQGATNDFAPDVDRLVQGGVARGRTRRRRRRVGTSLAAVAVIGILGAAAGVGSQLIGGDAAPAPSQYADATAADPASDPAPDPTPGPDPSPDGATTTLPIDATIAVSARDVPGIVDDLVPGGDVGEAIEDPTLFVDLPRRIMAPFLYDGTFTTVGIESAAGLATCAALVDPANQADGLPGGRCVEQDGATLLISDPETADGVTGQSVMAFVHGYVVSASSTDAVDDKDAEPVTDRPPLSLEELTTIATSDVWFEQ